jgi:lipopolysaccharide transport system ATP-binding protein
MVMPDVVIKVENLGKKYIIGHQMENGSYHTLRDVVMHNARSLWQKTRDLAQGKAIIQGNSYEEVWALKDVTFEVQRGEVLGIIGRNGAGKSTLLKVLSRITEPSAGRVTIKGRVASLLEVGTGFHPELSGRENIYLNGAILGMTRQEIKRKFDEIIEFAEIEKFLDTPVKRYSSGMYVRLAFSVAAHLEPEILLVDEVLAVGDSAFQKKCLGKMGDVSKEGKTVLFVSHNMATIQNLCETTILLKNGKIALNGTTFQVVQSYFQTTDDLPTADLTFHKGRRPGGHPILRSLRIFADDHEGSNIPIGGNLRFQVSFEHEGPIPNIRFGISVEDSIGQRLLNFSPSVQSPDLVKEPVCKGTFDCIIPQIRLLPGIYYLTLIIGNGSSDLDRIDRAGQFSVEAADVFDTGFPPLAHHGIYYQEAEWSFEGG